MVMIGTGPAQAGPPADDYVTPLLRARMGFAAPVFMLDPSEKNHQYLVDTTNKAGRADLLPGVEAAFRWMTSGSKDDYVEMMRILATPAAVSEMSDQWKAQSVTYLRGYFPPAA